MDILTYVDGANDWWQTLRSDQRIVLLVRLHISPSKTVQWAGSFDLFGDMPYSISTAIVKEYINLKLGKGAKA